MLFVSEKWITKVKDLDLLSKLVFRCCREKGLITTHKLLKDYPEVLTRLEKVNPVLAFKLRTGNLLGEFIVLNDEILSDIKEALIGIREYIITHQLAGLCSIEDRDGLVVFTSYMGNDVIAYTLDDETVCTLDDEVLVNTFNTVLEDTIAGVVSVVPVAIKRIRFPVEGEITRGYMFISEEKGSFEIRVD